MRVVEAEGVRKVLDPVVEKRCCQLWKHCYEAPCPVDCLQVQNNK